MRFTIRSLLILIFLCSVFLTVGVWTLGPVVPDSKLSQISPGMSRSKVLRILGKPALDTGEEAARYPHLVIYKRMFNPGWVRIYFNENNALVYMDSENVF